MMIPRKRTLELNRSLPIRNINMSLRNYICIDCFNFLASDPSSNKKGNFRFCIYKKEQRRLQMRKNKLLQEVKLHNMRALNDQIWSDTDMDSDDYLLDKFYKNMLIFLENQGIFRRQDINNAMLDKYLQNPDFDPEMNLNKMGELKMEEFFSFVETIDYIINENLIMYFRIFLNFKLNSFLFHEHSPGESIYKPHMQYLTYSSHLYMQRVLLPFTKANGYELRLGILSWNIAGTKLHKKETYMDKLVHEIVTSNLDIFVLGLQEIVELKFSFSNLNKMMFQFDRITSKIKALFEAKLGSFICISMNNLFGLFQMVFVRRRQLSEVDWFYHDNWQVKLGGAGAIKMGNKGVVGSLFEFKNFGRFAFLNCHMVHGLSNIDTRIEHFNEIGRKLKGKHK